MFIQPPNTPKRTNPDEEDEEEWENPKKLKKVIRTPYHPRQRATPRELGTPIRSHEREISKPLDLPAPKSDADILEPQLTDKEKEDILKYVETEAAEVEALDESTLKRIVLLFEKRSLRNQEMRVKFPDNPEK